LTITGKLHYPDNQEVRKMLKIHKKIVIDEKQNPVAVQISIEEFERLEEIIENYGLSHLMDEVKDDERLTLQAAKKYYKALK
jgi:PHD/YefM family antitoxin component YafN of YafNO toxin-antitoxin module